jgi:hypothetical protein
VAADNLLLDKGFSAMDLILNQKPVVEANFLSHGVSGFPEFEELCLTRTQKQRKYISEHELLGEDKNGSQHTDLANAVHGKTLNSIIVIEHKRSAIEFGHGLPNELKQKLLNAMSYVMNATTKRLILLNGSKASSFTELRDVVIKEAVGALSAALHIIKVIQKIGSAAKLPQDTHVNVLWSIRRTGLRCPRVHQLSLKSRVLLRARKESTADMMVGSSCREWTHSIIVYQITKAKNILAKVMGFLKGLMPTFDLNFAPALMAA